MDSIVTKCIADYYEKLDMKPIITESVFSIPRILCASSNTVVVSDNKLVRGSAKIRRFVRPHIEETGNRALQYYALQDAFSILYRKAIPVYFYNRIGKEKNGFQYTKNEQRRMEAGLSFPVMYQDIEKYSDELQDVFGELYSKEYIKEIGQIPQVIKVGDKYRHEDCHTRLINVENGKRITLYQPKKYSRTIHVYGRCGAFGYAVEDKDSLPSLIQKELKVLGITDIKVINHGLWGGTDEYLDHNFLHEAIEMKEGDIVLFYRKHFDKKLLNEFIRCGVRYKELTDDWHARKDINVTFFDRPGHMNADGYKLVAKLICEDLVSTGFSCGDYDRDINSVSAKRLNYYLKSGMNKDFAKEIQEYVDGINKDYPLKSSMISNGAIVMNCNPFTQGHRYLIEKSAKQVDRLYVFVVEEDKSFFLFKDRFEMVKRGVENIKNVVVVPSGKFIISAYTFPEYFMKDYVKEKEIDVSMDVETFCKYIAPPLNIRYRFAGEEPFDPVTNNYNENMKRILPEHGMNFVEIPRFALDEKRIVNATRVRELLKNREFEELKEYVPQSTYDVLKEKYVDY